MDEAELVRDYIDVLIWPLAILAIVALVVFRFRDQIAQVILRIQTVRGPGGSEILAPLEEQAVDVEQPPPPESEAEQPAAEEDVERPLPEQGEQHRDAGDADKEARLLTAQLAEMQRELYYERVYRVVWGTQITFLKALSERLDGISMFEVITTYLANHNKAAQAVSPSYKRDFTSYMKLLSDEGLVEFAQTEPTNYVITALGRAFLAYLITQGIPTWKQY